MNENPFVKGKSAPDTDHFDEKTTTFAKGVAFSGEKSIIEGESELTLLIVRKPYDCSASSFALNLSKKPLNKK